MSRIRFKTIHEIQIVFGRQFAFVSLKDLSPQKYVAKMTRPWRMILTTFFASVGQSGSLAEEHNFVLHENAFTPKCFPTTEQFTFNYVDCQQVADVMNAMPSNKAPGIDRVPTRVLKDSLLITLPFITSIINASLLASTFQRSGKLPKLHLFPNKATTNFLTITDRFPCYLHCQTFAREWLIIRLSPI